MSGKVLTKRSYILLTVMIISLANSLLASARFDTRVGKKKTHKKNCCFVALCDFAASVKESSVSYKM